MLREIKTINMWAISFILRGAVGVNCYLVKTDAGYVLIDTGFHSNRTGLVQELERAGCEPGKLLLIVITHGDLDHIGNCAYLRKRYGAKITIHCGETEAVERGDMALNRKNRPGLIAGIFLSLVSLLSRSDRFKPDVYVADGDDLSRYGFDARVIHFPGHSKGSIGVLTASGNIFCGDLILNIDRPSPSASEVTRRT